MNAIMHACHGSCVVKHVMHAHVMRIACVCVMLRHDACAVQGGSGLVFPLPLTRTSPSRGEGTTRKKEEETDEKEMMRRRRRMAWRRMRGQE